MARHKEEGGAGEIHPIDTRAFRTAAKELPALTSVLIGSKRVIVHDQVVQRITLCRSLGVKIYHYFHQNNRMISDPTLPTNFIERCIFPSDYTLHNEVFVICFLLEIIKVLKLDYE